MHTDKRQPDVKTCVRLDIFNGNGFVKALVSRSGKRAAGFGLRTDIDNFKAVLLRCFSFDNQRPVQVLTALCGKLDTVLLKNRINGTENLFSGFE